MKSVRGSDNILDSGAQAIHQEGEPKGIASGQMRQWEGMACMDCLNEDIENKH